eukprot:1160383-Pelagomonas_calceolata.AAC.6
MKSNASTGMCSDHTGSRPLHEVKLVKTCGRGCVAITQAAGLSMKLNVCICVEGGVVAITQAAGSTRRQRSFACLCSSCAYTDVSHICVSLKACLPASSSAHPSTPVHSTFTP